MDVSYIFDSKLIIYKLKKGLNRIKDNLAKKGLETTRVMGKTFRKMRSYDGFNKISKDDLHLSLRELGINLQKQDIDVIYFKYLK